MRFGKPIIVSDPKAHGLVSYEEIAPPAPGATVMVSRKTLASPLYTLWGFGRRVQKQLRSIPPIPMNAVITVTEASLYGTGEPSGELVSQQLTRPIAPGQ